MQNEPLRLVIVLHGITSSMRDIFNFSGRTGRWLTLSEEQGFLVIAPNGVGITNKNDTKGNNQCWNDNVNRIHPDIDDVGFIMNVIDWSISERNIDPRYIYIAGVSNGGILTYRILLEHQNKFAAAITFIANMPNEYVPLPSNTTPIMIMLGTADPIMKYDGGNVTLYPQGVVRSGEMTRNYWISANHVDESIIERNQLENYNKYDSCIISYELYNRPNISSSSSNSNSSSPVLFYTMRGGGHSSPVRSKMPIRFRFLERILFGPQCRDASGIDLAWNFLSNFSKL